MINKTRRRLLVAAIAAVALAIPASAQQRPSNATSNKSSTPLFRPRRVVPPRPAIIDAPVIAGKEVADQVTANELVIGVVVNGEARAYPINMLTGPSREIINDTLGSRAIAATW